MTPLRTRLRWGRALGGAVVAFALSLSIPLSTLAHCPLCVVGAGAGLSLARLLGIDDSITGVWIAALLGALALWTNNLLKKQYIPLQRELLYLGFFGLTLWSFYSFNDFAISKYNFALINVHAGQIFGLDKLTFGIVAGGVLFYIVDVANALVRQKRGKSFFPYQGVVVSLASILLLSIIVWVLINYYV